MDHFSLLANQVKLLKKICLVSRPCKNYHIIVISFYRNNGCQNCLCDEGLSLKFFDHDIKFVAFCQASLEGDRRHPDHLLVDRDGPAVHRRSDRLHRD